MTMHLKKRLPCALVLVLLFSQNAAAQAAASGQQAPPVHSSMGHDRSAADHAAMGHAPSPGASTGSEPGMQMGRMQGGPAPAGARDPNAYNEGARFAHLGNHEMNDDAPFWKVLLDKAEAAKGDGEQGQNLEFEAWYGNDYDKA
jgi:copper resistance protein B